MSIQYCRHIKVNGERCGSPALRDDRFCYYHVELNRRHRCSPRRESAPTILHPMTLQDGSQRDPVLTEPVDVFPQLDLPQLEDRHSIQVALSLIINALAQNRIDPARAMQLFYGLQVASSNAHLLNPIPKRYLGKVSLTVLDESNGNRIAPEGDPEDPAKTAEYETPGTATQYWNMLQAEEEEKDRLKAEASAKAIADAVAAGIAEITATFNACGVLTPADRLSAVSLIEAAATRCNEPMSRRIGKAVHGGS